MSKRNQTKKKKRRRRVPLSLILLALLLIALAAVIVFFIMRETKPAESDTAQEAEQSFYYEATNDAGFDEKSEQTEPEEPEPSPEELYEQEVRARVEGIVSAMTLEEKLCQMFVVTPEMLTGYETVTAAGEATRAAYDVTPVGGIVYFKKNLIDPAQTAEMLSDMSKIASDRTGVIPFLCVDEEGGTVLRIGSNEAFGVTRVGAMQEVTSAEEAYSDGQTIGTYLSELGFNVDFAPCADVLTNPYNEAIGSRSFGSDAEVVSEYAAAFSDGLHDGGALSTYKHFPGHGGTSTDSHEGMAYIDKTLAQLMEQELVPFMAAEAEGVDFVMVGHISCPAVTGNNIPASLSEEMITGVLRAELGYNGLIITDSLSMGAVTEICTPAEAAIMAVSAGADLLLMPRDFDAALAGLETAIENGVITEERIDASVRRIIEKKVRMYDAES